MAERHTGKNIRILRSDCGGECLSNRLPSHLDSTGINQELTKAFSPHQDGIAERLNRTLVSLELSMLEQKGLPKFLWVEALSIAV